jgi:hypothetical protein
LLILIVSFQHLAGAVLKTVELDSFGFCARLSASSATTVFVGGQKGMLLMCDTARDTRKPLPGHTHDVLGLCMSEDGKRIASGSVDKTVRLWDATTGRNLWTSSELPNWVLSVAIHGSVVFCGVHQSRIVGLLKSDGDSAALSLAEVGRCPWGLAVTRGKLLGGGQKKGGRFVYLCVCVSVCLSVCVCERMQVLTNEPVTEATVAPAGRQVRQQKTSSVLSLLWDTLLAVHSMWPLLSRLPQTALLPRHHHRRNASVLLLTVAAQR